MQEICLFCGMRLPEGSSFCPECGQKIPPETEIAQPEIKKDETAFALPQYPLLTNIDSDLYSGSLYLPTELRHAFLFLEDGEWNNAARYLVWAQERDPDNPYILLARTMSNLMIHDSKELYERMNEVQEEQNYTLFRRAIDQTK